MLLFEPHRRRPRSVNNTSHQPHRKIKESSFEPTSAKFYALPVTAPDKIPPVKKTQEQRPLSDNFVLEWTLEDDLWKEMETSLSSSSSSLKVPLNGTIDDSWRKEVERKRSVQKTVANIQTTSNRIKRMKSQGEKTKRRMEAAARQLQERQQQQRLHAAHRGYLRKVILEKQNVGALRAENQRVREARKFHIAVRKRKKKNGNKF